MTMEDKTTKMEDSSLEYQDCAPTRSSRRLRCSGKHNDSHSDSRLMGRRGSAGGNGPRFGRSATGRRSSVGGNASGPRLGRSHTTSVLLSLRRASIGDRASSSDLPKTSRRRSSITHVKAPERFENEPSSPKENRRRRLSLLAATASPQRDPTPKDVKKNVRGGGRRSSLFHVNQPSSPEDSPSNRRLLKNPFARQHSSKPLSSSKAHKCNKMKKCKSVDAELKHNLEDMELLMKAIQKNPDQANKILQEHWHKKQPQNFAPIGIVSTSRGA